MTLIVSIVLQELTQNGRLRVQSMKMNFVRYPVSFKHSKHTFSMKLKYHSEKCFLRRAYWLINICYLSD